MRRHLFHILSLASICFYAGFFSGPALSAQTIYVRSWSINDTAPGEWKKFTGEEAKVLGTTEVSLFAPGTEATAEQQKAAKELVVQTTAAAFKHNWFDFDAAVAQGYKFHDSLHWMKEAYLADGHILDPDKPENLMYYRAEDGTMKLAGVMYLLDSDEGHGPQVGGPLTVWHYHISPVPLCWMDFATTPNPRLKGPCDLGKRNIRSPQMLHVWLVDHPEGTFATRMELPEGVKEARQCLIATP